MATEDTKIKIKIRVDDSGVASVMSGTGQEIRNLGRVAEMSADQLRDAAVMMATVGDTATSGLVPGLDKTQRAFKEMTKDNYLWSAGLQKVNFQLDSMAKAFENISRNETKIQHMGKILQNIARFGGASANRIGSLNREIKQLQRNLSLVHRTANSPLLTGGRSGGAGAIDYRSSQGVAHISPGAGMGQTTPSRRVSTSGGSPARRLYHQQQRQLALAEAAEARDLALWTKEARARGREESLRTSQRKAAHRDRMGPSSGQSGRMGRTLNRQGNPINPSRPQGPDGKFISVAAYQLQRTLRDAEIRADRRGRRMDQVLANAVSGTGMVESATGRRRLPGRRADTRSRGRMTGDYPDWLRSEMEGIQRSIAPLVSPRAQNGGVRMMGPRYRDRVRRDQIESNLEALTDRLDKEFAARKRARGFRQLPESLGGGVIMAQPRTVQVKSQRFRRPTSGDKGTLKDLVGTAEYEGIKAQAIDAMRRAFRGEVGYANMGVTKKGRSKKWEDYIPRGGGLVEGSPRSRTVGTPMWIEAQQGIARSNKSVMGFGGPGLDEGKVLLGSLSMDPGKFQSNYMAKGLADAIVQQIIKTSDPASKQGRKLISQSDLGQTIGSKEEKAIAKIIEQVFSQEKIPVSLRDGGKARGDNAPKRKSLGKDFSYFSGYDTGFLQPSEGKYDLETIYKSPAALLQNLQAAQFPSNRKYAFGQSTVDLMGAKKGQATGVLQRQIFEAILQNPTTRALVNDPNRGAASGGLSFGGLSVADDSAQRGGALSDLVRMPRQIIRALRVGAAGSASSQQALVDWLQTELAATFPDQKKLLKKQVVWTDMANKAGKGQIGINTAITKLLKSLIVESQLLMTPAEDYERAYKNLREQARIGVGGRGDAPIGIDRRGAITVAGTEQGYGFPALGSGVGGLPVFLGEGTGSVRIMQAGGGTAPKVTTEVEQKDAIYRDGSMGEINYDVKKAVADTLGNVAAPNEGQGSRQNLKYDPITGSLTGPMGETLRKLGFSAQAASLQQHLTAAALMAPQNLQLGGRSNYPAALQGVIEKGISGGRSGQDVVASLQRQFGLSTFEQSSDFRQKKLRRNLSGRRYGVGQSTVDALRGLSVLQEPSGPGNLGGFGNLTLAQRADLGTILNTAFGGASDPRVSGGFDPGEGTGTWQKLLTAYARNPEKFMRVTGVQGIDTDDIEKAREMGLLTSPNIMDNARELARFQVPGNFVGWQSEDEGGKPLPLRDTRVAAYDDQSDVNKNRRGREQLPPSSFEGIAGPVGSEERRFTMSVVTVTEGVGELGKQVREAAKVIDKEMAHRRKSREEQVKDEKRIRDRERARMGQGPLQLPPSAFEGMPFMPMPAWPAVSDSTLSRSSSAQKIAIDSLVDENNRAARIAYGDTSSPIFPREAPDQRSPVRVYNPEGLPVGAINSPAQRAIMDNSRGGGALVGSPLFEQNLALEQMRRADAELDEIMENRARVRALQEQDRIAAAQAAEKERKAAEASASRRRTLPTGEQKREFEEAREKNLRGREQRDPNSWRDATLIPDTDSQSQNNPGPRGGPFGPNQTGGSGGGRGGGGGGGGRGRGRGAFNEDTGDARRFASALRQLGKEATRARGKLQNLAAQGGGLLSLSNAFRGMMAMPGRLMRMGFRAAGAFYVLNRAIYATQAAVGFLTSGFEEQIEMAESFKRLALPVDKLKELRLATSLTSASFKDVQVVFKNFARSIDKGATQSTNKYNQALRELGFTQKQVREGSINQADILDQTGKFLDKVGSGSTKAIEVLSTLGGRGAFNILPLIEMFKREDYDELTALVSNLGLEFGETDEEIRKTLGTAERLKYQFTLLSQVAKGFINQLNIGMGPALSGAGDILSAFIRDVVGLNGGLYGAGGAVQVLGDLIGSKIRAGVLVATRNLRLLAGELNQGASWSEALSRLSPRIEESFRNLANRAGFFAAEFGIPFAAGLAKYVAIGIKEGLAGAREALEDDPIARAGIGAVIGSALGGAYARLPEGTQDKVKGAGKGFLGREGTASYRQNMAERFMILEQAQREPEFFNRLKNEGLDGDELRRIRREAREMAAEGGKGNILYKFGDLGEVTFEDFVRGGKGSAGAALRQGAAEYFEDPDIAKNLAEGTDSGLVKGLKKIPFKGAAMGAIVGLVFGELGKEELVKVEEFTERMTSGLAMAPVKVAEFALGSIEPFFGVFNAALAVAIGGIKGLFNGMMELGSLMQDTKRFNAMFGGMFTDIFLEPLEGLMYLGSQIAGLEGHMAKFEWMVMNILGLSGDNISGAIGEREANQKFTDEIEKVFSSENEAMTELKSGVEDRLGIMKELNRLSTEEESESKKLAKSSLLNRKGDAEISIKGAIAKINTGLSGALAGRDLSKKATPESAEALIDGVNTLLDLENELRNKAEVGGLPTTDYFAKEDATIRDLSERAKEGTLTLGQLSSEVEYLLSNLKELKTVTESVGDSFSGLFENTKAFKEFQAMQTQADKLVKLRAYLSKSLSTYEIDQIFTGVGPQQDPYQLFGVKENGGGVLDSILTGMTPAAGYQMTGARQDTPGQVLNAAQTVANNVAKSMREYLASIGVTADTSRKSLMELGNEMLELAQNVNKLDQERFKGLRGELGGDATAQDIFSLSRNKEYIQALKILKDMETIEGELTKEQKESQKAQQKKLEIMREQTKEASKQRGQALEALNLDTQRALRVREAGLNAERAGGTPRQGEPRAMADALTQSRTFLSAEEQSAEYRRLMLEWADKYNTARLEGLRQIRDLEKEVFALANARFNPNLVGTDRERQDAVRANLGIQDPAVRAEADRIALLEIEKTLVEEIKNAEEELGDARRTYAIEYAYVNQQITDSQRKVLEATKGISDETLKAKATEYELLRQMHEEYMDDVINMGDSIRSFADKAVDSLFAGEKVSFGDFAKDWGKTWFKAIINDKLQWLDLPMKANFFELGGAFGDEIGKGGAEGAETSVAALKGAWGKGGLSGLTDALGGKGVGAKGKGIVQKDKQGNKLSEDVMSSVDSMVVYAQNVTIVGEGVGGGALGVTEATSSVLPADYMGPPNIPAGQYRQGDPRATTMGFPSPGFMDFSSTFTPASSSSSTNPILVEVAGIRGGPSKVTGSPNLNRSAPVGTTLTNDTWKDAFQGIVTTPVNEMWEKFAPKFLGGGPDGAYAASKYGYGAEPDGSSTYANPNKPMSQDFEGPPDQARGQYRAGEEPPPAEDAGPSMSGSVGDVASGALSGAMAAMETFNQMADAWLTPGVSGFADEDDRRKADQFMSAGIPAYYEALLIKSSKQWFEMTSTVMGGVAGAVLGAYGMGSVAGIAGMIIGAHAAMQNKLILGDISEKELRFGNISYDASTWAHDPLGTLLFMLTKEPPNWDQIMRDSFARTINNTEAGQILKDTLGGLDRKEGYSKAVGWSDVSGSGRDRDRYYGYQAVQYDEEGLSMRAGTEGLTRKDMQVASGLGQIITGRMTSDKDNPQDAATLGVDAAYMFQKRRKQLEKDADKMGLSGKGAETWIDSMMRDLLDEMGINLAVALQSGFSVNNMDIDLLRRGESMGKDGVIGFNQDVIEGNDPLNELYDPGTNTIEGMGPEEFEDYLLEEALKVRRTRGSGDNKEFKKKYGVDPFTVTKGRTGIFNIQENDEFGDLYEKVGENLYNVGMAIDSTFGDQLPKGINGVEMLLLGLSKDGEYLINDLSLNYQELLEKLGGDEEAARNILADLAIDGYEVDLEDVEKLIVAATASSEIMQGAFAKMYETTTSFENRWMVALATIAASTVEVFKTMWKDATFNAPVASAMMPLTSFYTDTLVGLDEGTLDEDYLYSDEFNNEQGDRVDKVVANIEQLGPKLRRDLANSLRIEDTILEAFGMPTRSQQPIIAGYKQLFANIDKEFSAAFRIMKEGLGQIILDMFTSFMSLNLDEQVKRAFAPVTDLFDQAEQMDLLGEGDAAQFVVENLPAALERSRHNLDLMKPELRSLFDRMKMIREWLVENGFIPDPDVVEWYNFLNNVESSFSGSVASGMTTGFAKVVNDPNYTKAEMFTEMGKNLERTVYSAMLDAMVKAAIVATGLGDLFKQIGALIAVGVAEGFSKGLLGQIEGLVGYAVELAGQVWNGVEPFFDMYGEKAYKTEQDVTDSLDKTSCKIDFAVAEQKAGAAILSNLGRAGQVYGGVALPQSPVTSTGPSLNSGPGPSGSIAGPDLPTPSPGTTGGPGTTQSNLGQFLQDPTMSAAAAYKFGGEQENPYAWIEKGAYRIGSDRPLMPVDPDSLSPNLLNSPWGQWFAPYNAMFYNGLKNIWGVGTNDAGSGMFPTPSTAGRWWNGEPGGENYPLYTNAMVDKAITDHYAPAMQAAFWPRMFAEGGIVKSATLGVVGEAGPEAIIPLSKISEVADDLNISSGSGAGSGDNTELISELNEVKEALLALANAIGEQSIETNVQIDGKTLVQQISKAARVMGKGNTFILPKNTVR